MRVFVVSRGMPTEKYPLNGIFEFDQAKALVQSGVDVTMLVIDYRSNSYRRKYGCFLYDKESVHVAELSLPLGIYRRVLPLLQMFLVCIYKKAVKKFGKPDIIHAHFYSIAAIASVLKKWFKIPFFVTEHSSKMNKNILNISKLDIKLAKKAYQNADNIIAVSSTLAKNLKNNFGIDATVIPNIVDMSNFQYVEREKKDFFTFVSVGNLVLIKGFDMLIRAFADAFRNDNVFLKIVGDGLEKNNLQEIVNQCDMGRQIVFLGKLSRDKLRDVYYNGDVFVLASRSETFGLSYVEAMASGMPVVATDCGGPSDFVNEQNGYLVPVDDQNALTAALIRIHDNIFDFNRLKISELCIKKFSPENIGKQLNYLYKNQLLR